MAAMEEFCFCRSFSIALSRSFFPLFHTLLFLPTKGTGQLAHDTADSSQGDSIMLYATVLVVPERASPNEETIATTATTEWK
jgi:hypothetical protein